MTHTTKPNPAHLFAEPLAMPAEHARSQMTLAMAAMNGQPIKPAKRVLNLPASVTEQYSPLPQDGGDQTPYHRVGPLAIIQIDGPMWFSASVWSAYCPGGSVSALLRMMERAGSDSDVKAVVLAIDSPGGEHHPLSEIADAMRRLTAIKPVHAMINNKAHSQGFMAACLATEISAVESGACGSIGSISFLLDDSKHEEAMGFKWHAITSASKKAVGGPGQAISDEQLAGMQDFVNRCGADFAAVVVEGRKSITAEMIDDWDGRIFYGQEMVENGLVDRLESEHAFYARLMDLYTGTQTPQSKSPQSKTPQSSTSSTNNHTPRNAASRHGERTMTTKNEANADLIKKLEEEEGADNSALIEKIKSMSDDDETKNEEEKKDEKETANEEEKKDDEDPKNAAKNAIPANNGGVPATFNELDEIVPAKLKGRDSIINNMLRKNTTVAGATSYVNNQLVEVVNDLSTKLETATKIANETSTVSQGRKPLPGGGGGAGGGSGVGNATAAFENARDALMQKHGIPSNEAIQRLRKEQPEVVQNWLAEINSPS